MIRFVRWIVRLEFNIWRSLLWWIVRRKPGPARARAPSPMHASSAR